MDVISLAEELAAEFGGRAADVDRSGVFPMENIDRMKETGYLKIAVPEELGGFGADLETVCAAQAIVAGGCASTALASNMHIVGIARRPRAGTPATGAASRSSRWWHRA